MNYRVDEAITIQDCELPHRFLPVPGSAPAECGFVIFPCLRMAVLPFEHDRLVIELVPFVVSQS